MNIVFVKTNATYSQKNNSAWRGILIFETLRKMGLHNVQLINSDEFGKNSRDATNHCNSSNLIVIEGSPEFDLLSTINHWKSRGKKVIVDIPLLSESNCQFLYPKSEGLFSISQIYSDYHSNEGKTIDQSEKFRWGLHLADCILVSSLVQQELWSVTAPVRVIPEFIDFNTLREKARIIDNSFVVAFMSNAREPDEFLESVIERINSKYPKTKWLNICSPTKKINFPNEVSPSDLPSRIKPIWPDFLPVVDLALFWDTQILRGAFYRNILEMMSLHIPWVINDVRGYQDLSKYGLIIHNHMNWYDVLDRVIQNSVMHTPGSDEGYLYSLSQNYDDQIHEVLAVFSEILKTPS